MEHETLFTATKWDILKLLESDAKSPLELAKALHSSLANVSQQLRLLEMAGLVTSRRISNRDKDKPRILYSLAGNLSYVIATSDRFVDKKVVPLSEHNKVILRIWFLDDANVRYALEKAFWQIEPHLAQISALSFAGIERGSPVIEYDSTAKLPAEIEVGGAYSIVRLRATTKPKGPTLFGRQSGGPV
jgi:DNA-binding transcriptional ArsR family regulator